MKVPLCEVAVSFHKLGLGSANVCPTDRGGTFLLHHIYNVVLSQDSVLHMDVTGTTDNCLEICTSCVIFAKIILP
jgi:hypothetical protein